MPVSATEIKIVSKQLDMPGRLFVPEGTEELPGIVMLHDFYGLDDATIRAAERLAGLGAAVAVPDLFADGGPADASSDAALLDFTQGLADSKLVAKAIATLNSLVQTDRVKPGANGVIGWGWAGAYALMAAAHDARFRVALDIGGAISYPVLTGKKPGSPLNFVASLDGALFAAFPANDPTLPAIEIERLRGRLVEHDKRGEIKIYADTEPRFWRDESLPQTQALWRRIEEFLRDNIDAPEVWAEGYPNEEYRLHA